MLHISPRPTVSILITNKLTHIHTHTYILYIIDMLKSFWCKVYNSIGEINSFN